MHVGAFRQRSSSLPGTEVGHSQRYLRRAQCGRSCDSTAQSKSKTRLVNLSESINLFTMNHFYRRFRAVGPLTLTLLACTVPAIAEPGASGVSTPFDNATSQVYLGSYAEADQALVVNVDGTLYKGHYARNSAKGTATQTGSSGANEWGSAFLFASSAKILQCRLDQGAPKMVGQCQDAQGRQFRLQAAGTP